MPIISDKYNFKMVSSDSTPQYKKDNNLILIVCLHEQMLEQTRCKRNMVEQYRIKMKDITIYTTRKAFNWMMKRFSQRCKQTRCMRNDEGKVSLDPS